MSSLSGASLCEITDLVNHPNADRLDIVEVQGCPAIVGRGEFELGETVVFVPFDMVVPNSENFPEFVRGKRVRPVKLRGIFSMGLVLKNKWDFGSADNIDECLGLEKWEPVLMDGEEIVGPRLVCPKYDIESLRKYHHLLHKGEEVVCSEKIHGTNAAYVYHDNQLWVKSRTRWLKENDSVWWRIARQEKLEEKLKVLPDHVLLGEVFGQVQDLKYGAGQGELKFLAFDLFNPHNQMFMDYWPFANFCYGNDIKTVPSLYIGEWKGFDEHKKLAEGLTTLGWFHVREGFVVRPVVERDDNEVGRVILELHGEGYLLRK